MTGLIRTLGGDLAVELAGVTYAHEHLLIDSPVVAETMAHIHLPSVDEAIREVQTCIGCGVRTMVDAMPAASGRDPERLSRISVLTGVRVVAATGLHTDKYYGAVEWTRSETPEQLAQRFIADIEEGIDYHDYRSDIVERSPFRAGIVKVASLSEDLSDRDRRVYEAGAITSQVTGVPVLTHTEGGLGGLNQVEFLLGLGVPPGRIALSHTDKVDDLGYHQAMLETGVSLCYDQGLREPDRTFALVEAMAAIGHGDQLVMGTDGARRSLWSTLGGSPGLAWLYDAARRRLEPELVGQVFVSNPARWLTLAHKET